MRKPLKALAWAVTLGAAVMLMGGLDQATKDALKVQHILKTIQRRPSHADRTDLTAEVSERELNAYIAHRLKAERHPMIKRLTVDLMANNLVRGSVRFNARGLNLDKLLGEALDFEFKGVFHTRGRAARLDLISLSLAGHAVKPQVLDFVLGTAASSFGTELGRIDDWYALPEGIEHVGIQQDKAIIHY